MKKNFCLSFKSGFAPLVLVLIITAIMGAGAGGYVYFSKKRPAIIKSQSDVERSAKSPIPEIQPELQESGTLQPSKEQNIVPPSIRQIAPKTIVPPTVQAPAQISEVQPTAPKISGSFIGLWKAEKLLGFNPQTQQWEEGKLLMDVYFEFKEDGNACGGGWTVTTEGYHCGLYYPYIVSGETIQIPRTSSVYKWKIVNGNLEMIAEIGGTPFLKYIAPPTTYMATMPPPKTDFTSPIVQSFNVTVSVNPGTGKKEATLKCRATDDTAVKYIWINLQYAGENINWSRTPQVDDTNLKDQTWTAPGFDAEKPGTHTATCKADDKAGNYSDTVEKTFIVP